MISWVVKGGLEVSSVAESAHLSGDYGQEKLEVPWGIYRTGFPYGRRSSDQRVC
jgi:hypothetical protein